MNIIAKYAIVLLLAIFQIGFLNNLSINGFMPNIFLVILALMAFLESPSEFSSPYLAFFAGIIWDLSFAKAFGVCTVLFFLMSILAKRMRSVFEPSFWFYSAFCILFFLGYFALEPLMQNYSYNLIYSAANVSRLATQYFINTGCAIGVFAIMDYGFGFVRNKAQF